MWTGLMTELEWVERQRLIDELGDLCGLPNGRRANSCGNAWCSYFDDEKGTCGLLVWDVPARQGIEALRWFVHHRVPVAGTEIDDEALWARGASL